eukprot:RCo050921
MQTPRDTPLSGTASENLPPRLDLVGVDGPSAPNYSPLEAELTDGGAWTDTEAHALLRKTAFEAVLSGAPEPSFLFDGTPATPDGTAADRTQPRFGTPDRPDPPGRLKPFGLALDIPVVEKTPGSDPPPPTPWRTFACIG